MYLLFPNSNYPVAFLFVCVYVCFCECVNDASACFCTSIHACIHAFAFRFLVCVYVHFGVVVCMMSEGGSD